MTIASRLKRTALSAATGLLVAGSLASTALAQHPEPKPGGTLTAALNLTFKTLDPVFGDADITDRLALNQIFEPLFRIAAKGEYQPVLAKSYQFNQDNTELTLELREGIRFHDGTPFNAEAVAFNLTRLNGARGAMRTGTVKWMKSAEVIGEYKVLIRLLQPSGYALSSLASEGTLIGSPAAIKKFGENFGRNPVGTGPFTFVEWVGAERLVLKKNPDYWQKDNAGRSLPYLDQVVIRSITNYATSILELESGGVQLLNSVNPQDFKRIKDHPDLELLEGPQVMSQHAVLAVDKPPFNDKRVRQAIAYGVDNKTLAQAIAGEYGLVYPTYMPPADWAFDKSLQGFSYQPEKARALLKEAGYGNGLSFEMLVIQREPDVTAAQIMQQMLKEIGVQMAVTVLERQAFIGRVITQGNYQGGMLAGQYPRLDPHDTFGRSFSANDGGNWSRHTNEAFVNLILKARDTVDRQERYKLYQEIARVALDESYMLYFYSRPAFQGVNTAVRNVEVDNGGAWVLTRTWVAR